MGRPGTQSVRADIVDRPRMQVITRRPIMHAMTLIFNRRPGTHSVRADIVDRPRMQVITKRPIMHAMTLIFNRRPGTHSVGADIVDRPRMPVITGRPVMYRVAVDALAGQHTLSSLMALRNRVAGNAIARIVTMPRVRKTHPVIPAVLVASQTLAVMWVAEIDGTVVTVIADHRSALTP